MNDTLARAPLVGIYGGTFDPIHYGHINTVSDVASHTDLASILFIPSALPPHRTQPIASADHRLAMTRLGIIGHPGFRVDDRELKRNRPSYMVDTIHSLKQEHPQNRYCLILGMDALLGLEKWYRWETLFDTVHFIVMQRPGWPQPRARPDWWCERQVNTFAQLHGSKTGRIYLVETQPIDIRATDIRARLKAGQNISHLVPAKVRHYIHEHQLYE